jgi:hypothetical protein
VAAITEENLVPCVRNRDVENEREVLGEREFSMRTISGSQAGGARVGSLMRTAIFTTSIAL